MKEGFWKRLSDVIAWVGCWLLVVVGCAYNSDISHNL